MELDNWQANKTLDALAKEDPKKTEAQPPVIEKVKVTEPEAKTEDPPAVEDLESDPEILRAKIKGLEKDAFKLREQKRKLKEEKAASDKIAAEIKSKAIDVDDFDSYEDYEKAIAKAKEPAPKADPVVVRAVDKILAKAEKAGLDREDFLDSLQGMKTLPGSLVATLADRRDGVVIAKWLAENEESDDAYDALSAITQKGADEALDAIAKKLSAASTKDEPKAPKSKVAVIPKLGGQGTGVGVDLNKLSTQEFIARQSESKAKRFW